MLDDAELTTCLQVVELFDHRIGPLTYAGEEQLATASGAFNISAGLTYTAAISTDGSNIKIDFGADKTLCSGTYQVCVSKTGLSSNMMSTANDFMYARCGPATKELSTM